MQGLPYTCQQLQIQGTVFIPLPTPRQKIEQVKMFGGNCITVKLAGIPMTMQNAQKEYTAAEQKTVYSSF